MARRIVFGLEVLNKNKKRMSDRIYQPSVEVMYPPHGCGIMFIKFRRFFQQTGSQTDPENAWDQITIYKRHEAERLAKGILRELHKLSD